MKHSMAAGGCIYASDVLDAKLLGPSRQEFVELRKSAICTQVIIIFGLTWS
jgi:hypothetical protein